MVFGDIVRKYSRLCPHRPAVLFEGTTIRWGELNERANRLGNALLRLGVEKGDRVAFISKNCHQFFDVWFALAKGGFAGITPNFRLSSKEFLYILQDAGAKVVIVSHEFGDKIKEIASGLDTVRSIIGLNGEHGFDLDYADLLSESSPEEPSTKVDENDVRLIMYTSGTTGKPKGAIWTHRSSLTPFPDLVIAAGCKRSDINMNIIPMCLAGGTMTSNTFAYCGALNVAVKDFDPVSVFRTIQEDKVTATTMVPTIIIALLNHPERARYDLSSLQKIIYGSAPISPEVLEQAMDAFKSDFVQAYGATETNAFSGYLYPEDHVLDGSERSRRRIASAGYEALWAQQRVVNENGEDVAPGEVGEIRIKGDGVIKEYWKAPEKTADSIRDGWWHSGDLATVDEDGYIYIVDRKIDMIISGAMNIYSREVEDVLYEHSAIEHAVVIGVPDEEWGESVKAVIQLKPGWEVTETQIIDHCLKYLADYKKPRSIDFVREMPMSSAGKILKRVIREEYWKGRERKV
ncbi:MAG: long-chain-fatty-acid--CoA ligase [Deltaproteobacteria bacterium]|nr:long-chain-fatty-acid--CoA ligase [Deltaproteobacteria bacterium]